MLYRESMILENFPQDLVLLVLTKCDVVTILKLEQVCAQTSIDIVPIDLL